MPPETATEIFFRTTKRGTGTALRRVQVAPEQPERQAGYVIVIPGLGSLGAWQGTVGLDLFMAATGLDLDSSALTRSQLPTLHTVAHNFRSTRIAKSRPNFDLTDFIESLDSTLEDQPVDSGIAHPGERVLLAAFEGDEQGARGQLRRWLAPADDSVKAEVLLLLGRIPHRGAMAIVRELAGPALREGSVELREAAIHALEAVRGAASRDILSRHREPDLVLREYVERVIRDLAD